MRLKSKYSVVKITSANRSTGTIVMYFINFTEYPCFYRLQTKFAKVMFLQVSVCPQGGGGGVRVTWHTPPATTHAPPAATHAPPVAMHAPPGNHACPPSNHTRPPGSHARPPVATHAPPGSHACPTSAR